MELFRREIKIDSKIKENKYIFSNKSKYCFSINFHIIFYTRNSFHNFLRFFWDLNTDKIHMSMVLTLIKNLKNKSDCSI